MGVTDLSIVKLMRAGPIMGSALLSDGRKAYQIPCAMLQVGTVVSPDCLRMVRHAGYNRWHYIQRTPRYRVLPSRRRGNLSSKAKIGQDASDWASLKRVVIRYISNASLREIGDLSLVPSRDALYDICADLYEHLLKRNWFDAWDPLRKPYASLEGYLWPIVHNFLISRTRNVPRQVNLDMLRLGLCPIEDTKYLNSLETLCQKEFSDFMRGLTSHLDEEALFEDGLPSYLDIFEAMQDNDFEALLENYVGVHRRRQFKAKVGILHHYLDANWDSFGGGCNGNNLRLEA